MSDDRLSNSGIYCIRNTSTGRAYIGKAVNIAQRWKMHRSELDRQVHVNKALQADWLVFGADAFAWDVLEFTDRANLERREYYHLNTADCALYNVQFYDPDAPRTPRRVRRIVALRREVTVSTTTDPLMTLTPAQVATLLQVHVRTVKRWLAEQTLPGFQLQGDAGKAGDWRVRRVDLERWMAERGREQRDGPEVMGAPPAAVAGT